MEKEKRGEMLPYSPLLFSFPSGCTLISRGMLFPPPLRKKKQEPRPSFYGLRRGIAEGFQRWAKFKGLCQKAPKKSPILGDLFFYLKITSELKFDLIRLP